MKFENTCRSCLQDPSELLSIFDYYEEDVNLCNIIKDISNVEVTYGDNLPDTICEPCLEQLRQIQKFRARLQYSDIILREYFANTVSNNPNKEASKILEGGDAFENEDLEKNEQITSSVNTITRIPQKVVVKLGSKDKAEPKPNAVTIKFHPKKTLNKLSNNEKIVKEDASKLAEPKTNNVVTNFHPKKTMYKSFQNEKGETKKVDDYETTDKLSQNKKSPQKSIEKIEDYESKECMDKLPQNKKSPQKSIEKIEDYESKECMDKLPQNKKSGSEKRKREVKIVNVQPKKTVDKLSEDEEKGQEEPKKSNEPKVQDDEVDELEEIRKFLNPKKDTENSGDDKTTIKLDSDQTVENSELGNASIKTERSTEDVNDEQEEFTNWETVDPFTSDEEYFPDDEERKRIKLETNRKFNKTTCHVCEEDLLTVRKLRIHKRVAHNIIGKHECSKCDLTFQGVRVLRKHMVEAHKMEIEDKFTCNVCFKVYHVEKTWREHVKSHNISATNSNTCKICKKTFMYPSLLTQHMKSHSNEKPFLCFYCGKGFRHQGQYDYHIREHMGDTPYKCTYCGKGFMSPGHLRIHMRKHTDERPYMCDLCGKGFRQICDLKSHRRVHLGIKPIECAVCKKKLSTTGQYTIHMRTHTGEKPFACPECERCFATRSMVFKHQATHSTEKPFSCAICDKKFRHKYSIVSHMRTHQRDTKPRSRPPKILVLSEKANRTHILVSKESEDDEEETII